MSGEKPIKDTIRRLGRQFLPASLSSIPKKKICSMEVNWWSGPEMSLAWETEFLEFARVPNGRQSWTSSFFPELLVLYFPPENFFFGHWRVTRGYFILALLLVDDVNCSVFWVFKSAFKDGRGAIKTGRAVEEFLSGKICQREDIFLAQNHRSSSLAC